MSPHCADLSILLPVDGSQNSDRAVRLLIELYPKLAPREVRLLHVVVPSILPDEKVSSQEANDEILSAARMDPLQSARALLESAGIPCTREIRRGYVAQEIAAYAKEFHCSGIIMGTRGMGTTEHILGSIVRQVVALTAIPVTLVK